MTRLRTSHWYRELISTLSELVGRTVEYGQLPLEQVEAQLGSDMAGGKAELWARGIVPVCRPEVFQGTDPGRQRDACEPDPQPALVEVTRASEILSTSSIAATGPGRAKR